MQIFKFGGAAVKNADGVKNLLDIVNQFATKKCVIVVSAMGKMTNAFEKLSQKAHKKENFQIALDEIITFHQQIINELELEFPELYLQFENQLKINLNNISTKEKEYNKFYDCIVPFGELMSTSIIYEFLKQTQEIVWFDARQLIRTDQYFSEANVDWIVTEKQILDLKPVLENKLIITQGFIGSDSEGNTTTLGREGSDYTAAILANCLNAEKMTVWKDVTGILNADPRIFSDTSQFEFLDYQEVTEMTYYGAQVIHPKTLKPLASKNIPLIVRSFIEKTNNGTLISEKKNEKLIPTFVFKKNQLLVNARVKDYSFMDERKLGFVLQVLDLLNIKINMMQNSALTVSFCIDFKEYKAKRIKELLNRDFILSFENQLNLATIKNYSEDSLSKIAGIKEKVLEQKTKKNYQVLYK